MDEQTLINKAIDLGASKASVIQVEDIVFNTEFRDACKSNACGMYGKCWTCPPYVGEINELIAKAKSFKKALVYQTISPLEDSYDIEGMLEAGARHNKLTFALRDDINGALGSNVLHLGAGGCSLCSKCAILEEKPCRFPDKALSSMEAYGIAVSDIAKTASMKYINGQDTVTYFAIILY